MGRLPAAMAGRYSLTVRGEKNNPFRRVVEAQLKFLSLLEMDGDRLPLSAAYLLSLPMRGLFAPKGGTADRLKRLAAAFTARGGVLMDRCSVIRVATEPDVAVDLECEGSSLKLRGEQLILSAQWEKMDLLLPVRKMLPKSGRRGAPLSPAAYPFCLHMGIHAKGLPECMAPYVVVVGEGSGPVTNRDLVFLQTSMQGDTDSAPEGRRAMTATVYLPDSPLRLGDQELKETAMGIIDALDGFLPFLRDNIDYLCVDESIRLARRYQEMVSRRYRMRSRPLVGLKTLSPRTRIPNVWLTGGILRAGLGFEGEILAGMDAAHEAGQGGRRR
jgi:phytoene dehydrogenase-like protein